MPRLLAGGQFPRVLVGGCERRCACFSQPNRLSEYPTLRALALSGESKRSPPSALWPDLLFFCGSCARRKNGSAVLSAHAVRRMTRGDPLSVPAQVGKIGRGVISSAAGPQLCGRWPAAGECGPLRPAAVDVRAPLAICDPALGRAACAPRAAGRLALVLRCGATLKLSAISPKISLPRRTALFRDIELSRKKIRRPCTGWPGNSLKERGRRAADPCVGEKGRSARERSGEEDENVGSEVL